MLFHYSNIHCVFIYCRYHIMERVTSCYLSLLLSIYVTTVVVTQSVALGDADSYCLDQSQWSRNRGCVMASYTPNNFNMGAMHPYTMHTPCYIKNCQCVCASYKMQ